MQGGAGAAVVMARTRDWDLFILDRDRSQPELIPSTPEQQLASQIVLVQPLHDEDDGAALLIIEPLQESVEHPCLGGRARTFEQCVVSLHGIIDNDEIGTATHEHTV